VTVEWKEINMKVKTVKIEKSDDTNFILGQTHFIKLAEDIHEALVGADSDHRLADAEPPAKMLPACKGRAE
jgi:adenosine/AMP kinase